MAVYIAVHKDVQLDAQKGYVPLQVGAAVHPPLLYLGDNTGIHISEKNPHYCELTGLFWIWQNARDSYKGLVHYRRFFIYRRRVVEEGKIRELLQDHDVILPRPEPLRERQLESKVNKHNQVIERTYELEKHTEVIDEQIRVANHRIGDLEHIIV